MGRNTVFITVERNVNFVDVRPWDPIPAGAQYLLIKGTSLFFFQK